MGANASIILEGELKSNGTLELWSPPAWPPGPVRVTLESLPGAIGKAALRPDPPWPDESISAPFDLPMPGNARPIVARRVAEVLPAPFELTATDLLPE